MKVSLIILGLVCSFSLEAQDYSFYEFIADGVRFKGLVLSEESALDLSLVSESELKGVLNDNEVVCISEVGFYDNGGNHVGLLQIEGKEFFGVDLGTKGNGNFYLAPNGVFSFDSSTKRITESNAYSTNRYKSKNSIQSGPLLIVNGELHPKLNLFSLNKHGRSAICSIPQNGQIYTLFITALDPVNMYTFSMVLKQRFNCDYALLVGSGNTCTSFPSSSVSFNIPTRPWYLVVTY